MKLKYNKLISIGALIALVGYLLSGPVAFLLVHFIKPQPLWISPAVFVENYHPIQDLPFYFGFLLIGGMLMLVAGHYLNYQGDNNKKKLYLLLALGWTLVFCSLISFNYICQITFVHNLACNYQPESGVMIAIFSMSNPLSLCWAIEMWGYAFLGVATWLMAEYYRNENNLLCLLLILNGIISVLSAAWTIVDVSWLMTTAGLIAYFTWNVLMIVIMVSILAHSQKSMNII